MSIFVARVSVSVFADPQVPFHDDQPVPAAASFQPLPAPQEVGPASICQTSGNFFNSWNLILVYNKQVMWYFHSGLPAFR